MSIDEKKIIKILMFASETHHTVYKKVQGVDSNWAAWYANWLLELSDLPELIECKPVESDLVYLLVKLDKEFTAQERGEEWQEYYATQIAEYSFFCDDELI